MKSMTGFGSSSGKGSSADLTISVRSVNGRFLEMRMHLPREYVSIEGHLKKMAEEYFVRGTVDVFVNRKVNTEGLAQPKIDMALAEKYLKSYVATAKKLKLKYTPNLETILRLPEVTQLEMDQSLDSKEEATVKKLFKLACEKCEEERLREGKALQKNLLDLVAALKKNVDLLQGHREDTNKMLQEKLEQRLQSRLKNLEVDPERLAQEVAILTDKADINEELVRLEEHLKSLTGFIKNASVEGKKLDFYTQELHREINTIGSKSPVVSMTHLVVESKTIIEKMKEQIQNIQ